MKPKEAVQLSIEVLDGVKKRKKYLGRQSIGTFESICLCFFASYASGVVPSSDAIAETIIAEDILERGNCFADEIKAYSPHIKGTSYEQEERRLLKHLEQRYKEVYPDTWNVRITNVATQLKYFHDLNKTIEEHIHSGSHSDKRFDSSIQQIDCATPIDRGRVHKETIDRAWIETVLSILYEGDEQVVKKIIDPMTHLTMLYQLIEDYANIKRDDRVGKKTIFTTNSGERTNSNLSHLLSVAEYYFTKIKVNDFERAIVELGWVTKLAISKLKSANYGDKWRDMANYRKADEFENKRFRIGFN